MKQIIDYKTSVSIQGKEFFYTSIWKHIKYIEPINEEHKFNTFEEAYNFIKQNKMIGIDVNINLFNKEQIVIHSDDIYAKPIKMTRKNFKPFIIKNETEELGERITIKELARELSADAFVEWLKDKDMQYKIQL